jgi:tRNA (guanine37-N1)-methyltransferase
MTTTASTLYITFLTLFPDAIEEMMDLSILGRAQKKGLLKVNTLQIRDYALDKHQTVDDTPCGGGAGQVMRVDVLHRAVEAAQAQQDASLKTRTILLDPAGKVFSQKAAVDLAQWDHLIFLCGRYEGVDARIWNYIDEVWSLGDFVITGGELAALVMVDAISRMRPGILGNERSIENESHMTPLLEHHQYTRPITYDQWNVPDVLLSGHHSKIEDARQEDAHARTAKYRPDLLNETNPATQMVLKPVRKEES